MLKILWRKCLQIALKIYESFLPQRFPLYGTWSYHLMWHVDEIVHVKQLHKGESYSCSLALKIRPLGFSTGLASPACVQDKQHGACCLHAYMYTMCMYTLHMLICLLLACCIQAHASFFNVTARNIEKLHGMDMSTRLLNFVSCMYLPTCTKYNAMPLTFKMLFWHSYLARTQAHPSFFNVTFQHATLKTWDGHGYKAAFIMHASTELYNIHATIKLSKCLIPVLQLTATPDLVAFPAEPLSFSLFI